MSVKFGLALDHFYVGIEAEAFDLLVPWIKDISGVKHSTARTGEDEWEGLYFSTRTNAYFELLRARREGCIGIAFTSVSPFYLDARKIAEELPDLPWNTGTRINPDGKPWFDWFTLGDYLNVNPSTPCNVWLMHFHMHHREWKFRRPKTAFDAITEISVTACREMREEISRSIPWTPTRVVEGDQENLYLIPDRDESEVRLQVRFQDGTNKPGQQFKLNHVEFRLSPNTPAPSAPPLPWKMETSKPGAIKLLLHSSF